MILCLRSWLWLVYWLFEWDLSLSPQHGGVDHLGSTWSGGSAFYFTIEIPTFGYWCWMDVCSWLSFFLSWWLCSMAIFWCIVLDVFDIFRDVVFISWCMIFELFIPCDLYRGWLCMLDLTCGILCNCILFHMIYTYGYPMMWMFVMF